MSPSFLAWKLPSHLPRSEIQLPKSNPESFLISLITLPPKPPTLSLSLRVNCHICPTSVKFFSQAVFSFPNFLSRPLLFHHLQNSSLILGSQVFPNCLCHPRISTYPLSKLIPSSFPPPEMTLPTAAASLLALSYLLSWHPAHSDYLPFLTLTGPSSSAIPPVGFCLSHRLSPEASATAQGQLFSLSTSTPETSWASCGL